MLEILHHGTEGEERLSERVVGLLKAQAALHGVVFSRRDIWLEAEVDGAFAGALSAKLGPAFMVVELLAVEDAYRGHGIGRALMQRAEELAQASGARGVWVDTFTFQAPGFYERLGYAEFGRIEDYTGGHDRVFLAKKF